MQSWLHNLDWAIAMRSDLLTPVFKGFTALGYGGFLLLFIPLGYWIISKNTFARLGLWLMLSALLNAYLKDLFQDPRPDSMFQLDPHIGQSYGFPSGHAQIAIVVWFWLAWEARKTWLWIVSSILVAGICFSRLYLGVHDVEDVLGGIGFGLICLIAFIFLTGKRFEWWHNLNIAWHLLALAVIEALLFLTWPASLPTSMIGYGVFLIGFWLAVGFERKAIRFQKHQDWWRVMASAVVGLIVFIALRNGFDAVEEMLQNGLTALAFIEAFVSGLFLAAVAPWMFQRLRLAEKGDLPPDTSI
jgi:membrane-associated phospholipid phosphatase